VGLEFYDLAFRQLSTCRPGGGGLAAIPWLAIHEWCKRYDLNDEDSFDLDYFVRKMDEAWLEYHDGKRKTELAIRKAQAAAGAKK